MSYTREEIIERVNQANSQRDTEWRALGFTDALAEEITQTDNVQNDGNGLATEKFNSYIRASAEALSWAYVLAAIDDGADPTIAVMRREVPPQRSSPIFKKYTI